VEKLLCRLSESASEINEGQKFAPLCYHWLAVAAAAATLSVTPMIW